MKLMDYQNLLLRDIWWSKFGFIVKCFFKMTENQTSMADYDSYFLAQVSNKLCSFQQMDKYWKQKYDL